MSHHGLEYVVTSKLFTVYIISLRNDRLDTLIESVARFMRDNPGEFVLLRLKFEGDTKKFDDHEKEYLRLAIKPVRRRVLRNREERSLGSYTVNELAQHVVLATRGLEHLLGPLAFAENDFKIGEATQTVRRLLI